MIHELMGVYLCHYIIIDICHYIIMDICIYIHLANIHIKITSYSYRGWNVLNVD